MSQIKEQTLTSSKLHSSESRYEKLALKQWTACAWKEHEDEEPFLSIRDAQQRQELVKELHLLKTDIFMKMVESGMMPLRPGVSRLVGASFMEYTAEILQTIA